MARSRGKYEYVGGSRLNALWDDEGLNGGRARQGEPGEQGRLRKD